jgi:hypothetical protein
MTNAPPQNGLLGRFSTSACHKPAPTTIAGLQRALKPLEGFRLPSDYSAAVRLVERPVIPITEAQYNALYTRSLRDECEVYVFRGGWVTFGTADGGYALWPLQAKPPRY